MIKPMIRLTSLSGPEVHGPRRYRVRNPATWDFEGCTGWHTDWGLSAKYVMLNGEIAYVDHVAHAHASGRTDDTLIIVVKPLRTLPARKKCVDLSSIEVLKATRDLEYCDESMLCGVFASWPKNLVRAKIRSLICRCLLLKQRFSSYEDNDDDARTSFHSLFVSGDGLAVLDDALAVKEPSNHE